MPITASRLIQGDIKNLVLKHVKSGILTRLDQVQAGMRKDNFSGKMDLSLE